MSTKRHAEKYLIKLITGSIILIGFVFLSFYAVVEKARQGDWYFWAIVAAVLLCAGIYFCLSAFVHKIKSDFNRRQKHRNDSDRAGSNDF